MSQVTTFEIATFWLPSALMGLGIAFDVAVATLARFRNKAQTWKNWTLPITLTHILFPALGYYSFWWLGSLAPALLVPLGVFAGVVVGLFLYEAFCGWVDMNPKIALSSIFDRFLPSVPKEAQGGIIAIFSVSVDAIFSGPAKAAQAEVAHWSSSEVFWSFLVAGVVVAVVAQLSLFAAKLLRKIKFTNLKVLAYWCLGGKFLEAAVIGGFGVLSLWSGLSIWLTGGNLLISIGISASVFVVLFSYFKHRLYQVQLTEFDEVQLYDKCC